MLTSHNPGDMPQRFERKTMVNVRIEYAAHTATVMDSIETLAARIVDVLAADRRVAAC
jgi:hypothetical protein